MRKDLKGFESLIQVTQHFSDINVCRRHLESLRWPDGKIACPHCGSFNRRPTGKLEDYSSPGAGISFYPFKWTRRTRFTVEYNYLDATLNNTLVEPDGQLGLVENSYGPQQSLRFQLQFGF